MDNMELTLTIEEEPQATLNLGVAEGATDEASARTAEAYAKGTRNGVPVEEGDPAYHNNAKYYRDSAAAIAAGDVIDDEAGAGDYNLTWSADKLTSQKADIEELESSKADAINVQIDTPASVMTFSDGADGMPMSATFEIAPVQDLHGYDNPWPAGGGKNKLDVTQSSSSQFTRDGEKFTNTTADGKTTFDLQVRDGSTTVASQSVTLTGKTVVSFTLSAETSQLKVRHNGNNNNLTISFSQTFAAGSYKLVMWMYGVNPSTAGGLSFGNVMILSSAESNEDFAPYENRCPITGWTGCKPSRTGKNLLDASNNTDKLFYNADGTTTTNVNVTCTDYIRVNPSETYTVSGTTMHGSGGDVGIRAVQFDANKVFISRSDSVVSGNKLSVTVGSTTAFVRFTYCIQATNVQVENGSSATAYEPFGTTYPVTFPVGAGTVYGGTRTVYKDGTGKLVVDRVTIVMDSSKVGSNMASKEGFYGAYYNDSSIPRTNNVTSDLICDVLPAKMVYSRAEAGIYANGSAGQFGMRVAIGSVREQQSTQADNVKQFIDENNPTLSYKLETPVSYDLTALEVIETLKGVNNIFCDTGDVLSVEYSADTKLYVDGKISEGMKLIALLLTANHENGMKASKAYASGDLLTVGNTLYKATTSIANGATLTAGTNVTETTIETELAALA